jgi:Tol biopolymer transport system component
MDWSSDGRKILYRTGRGPEFSLKMQDTDSRETVEVVRSEHTQFNARLSPDGAWLLFIEVFGPVEAKLWILPMKDSSVIPRSGWILINDNPALSRQASWAPDGNIVYFVSQQDTYRCIWAQRLDQNTKRPQGAPFPVQHFHGSMSLSTPNPRDVGLRATSDKLFFSLVESTGNIWMTRISTR